MIDLVLLAVNLFPLFLDCIWTLVFFLILFKAHLWYLHDERACWMCSCSSSSCCLVEHISFALWNNVLMTHYFAEMAWWLSHCKYWLVWVGFLYTDVDKVPSAWGVTWVSRKGKDPSPWVSSTVNWILSSIEFMCFKKSSLWDVLMTTKVSSTNLFHSVGGGLVLCCGLWSPTPPYRCLL